MRGGEFCHSEFHRAMLVKSGGFSFTIENPESYFRYAVKKAEEIADLPLESPPPDQFSPYGLVPGYHDDDPWSTFGREGEPNGQLVFCNMDIRDRKKNLPEDPLFRGVNFQILIGYQSTKGAYAVTSMRFDFTYLAQEQKIPEQLVSSVPMLVSRLDRKGLTVKPRRDKEMQLIDVSKIGGKDAPVTIYMGPPHHEILVAGSESPLLFDEYITTVESVLFVSSHVADSLYQEMFLEPPQYRQKILPVDEANEQKPE